MFNVIVEKKPGSKELIFASVLANVSKTGDTG